MGICLPLAQGQRNVARALIEGQNAIGHVKSFDGSMLASDLVSEFARQSGNSGECALVLLRCGPPPPASIATIWRLAGALTASLPGRLGRHPAPSTCG
jgi:hypothetical protein